jgi:hypothetical protein
MARHKMAALERCKRCAGVESGVDKVHARGVAYVTGREAHSDAPKCPTSKQTNDVCMHARQLDACSYSAALVNVV